MDLQQIRNFLKLAEELHFWNTAEKMNITQSALSRQIQALEDELDVRLFERNKRNVKLTLAGEFLREKWALLLDDIKFIHLFAKKISQGETGTIRIAHPDSISSSLLPQLIEKINARFPELRVELIQMIYENEREFLREYKIDLAFTRDVNRLLNITSRKIKSDQLALIVPESSTFHVYEKIVPDELKMQKFILPVADDNSSYLLLIREVFKQWGFEPLIVNQSDFGSTIISLVAKGLGIAILPLSYSFNETPGIRFIELPFKTDLYINWRTNDHNPVLKNILEIIDQLAEPNSL